MAKCVVGASLDGGEEEAGGNEEETAEGNQGKKENTYNIFGSIKKSQEDEEEYKKPDFVKEIIDVGLKTTLGDRA